MNSSPRSPRGRRRRPPKTSADGSNGTKKFAIALKAQAKPVGFAINKALEREFAIRYLEGIGVAPTKETMAMVSKKMPLSRCNVTTAWRSRGWISDTLFIEPHAPGSGPDEPHSGGAAASVSPAAKAEKLPSAAKAGKKGGGGGAAHATRAQDVAATIDQLVGTATAAVAQPGGRSPDGRSRKEAAAFEAIRSRHVYPYNLVHNPSITMHKNIPPLPKGSGALDSTTSAQLMGVGRNAVRGAMAARRFSGANAFAPPPSQALGVHNVAPASESLAQYNVRVAAEAVLRPLEVTAETIEAIQEDFCRVFPFRKLRGKMKPSEEEVLVFVLQSTAVVRLIGLSCHYLYWNFVRPALLPAGKRGSPADLAVAITDAERERLFLDWSSLHGELLATMQQSRIGATIGMPVLVLAVRSAVDRVFVASYRWFKLAENAAVYLLQRLQSELTALLDPDLYYSHVLPLGSTQEALVIIQREQHRNGSRAKPRLRDAYRSTSTAVRSVLSNACSHEARTILANDPSHQGGPPAAAKPPPGYRSKPSTLSPRSRRRPRSTNASATGTATATATDGTDAGELWEALLDVAGSVDNNTHAESSAAAPTAQRRIDPEHLGPLSRAKLLETMVERKRQGYERNLNRKMKEREALLAPEAERGLSGERLGRIRERTKKKLMAGEIEKRAGWS